VPVIILLLPSTTNITAGISVVIVMKCGYIKNRKILGKNVNTEKYYILSSRTIIPRIL